MGYSFRLAASILLNASSHRQDNTYHSLCYTSRGALAGMRDVGFKSDMQFSQHKLAVSSIKFPLGRVKPVVHMWSAIKFSGVNL